MTPLLLLLLFVKSLAVFALSGLTLLALRRASAASRHLVCLLTLAALLALPLFSQSPLSLPVAVPKMNGSPENLTPRPLLPQTEGAGTQDPAGAKAGPPAATEGQEQAAAPALVPPLLGARGSSPTFPELRAGGRSLLALWLCGVLLAAFRPLLGLWGISRLHRASRAETNPAVLTTTAEAAATLGLPRAPVVRRGNVPVPMTWGLRRPVVLLPDAADSWPEGRMQAVLRHELAHIRRRDWAAHRLADFACALYWFHPLVWLTARRLRAEGEIACDDLVLSSGIPAPDYARHLLDIARALSSAPIAPAGTVAMARSAHVEGRITMILKPAQNRRALPRRTLFVSLIAAALGVGTLAALRPAAQAAPAAPVSPTLPAQAAPVSVLAPKPQSSAPITLQFAGVGYSQKLKWWGKIGEAEPNPVADLAWTSIYSEVVQPNHRGLLFVFRLLSTAQDLTFSYTASNSGAGKTEAEHFYYDNGMLILKAYFPASASQTNIHMGIASDPWQTIATVAPRTKNHGLRATAIQVDHTGYIISEPTKTTEGTVCTVSVQDKSKTATQDFRLVALTTQGQESLPGRIIRSNANSVRQITARFSLPPSQIKTIKLQTRPFHYVQFKNIALYPTKH